MLLKQKGDTIFQQYLLALLLFEFVTPISLVPGGPTSLPHLQEIQLSHGLHL